MTQLQASPALCMLAQTLQNTGLSPLQAWQEWLYLYSLKTTQTALWDTWQQIAEPEIALQQYRQAFPELAKTVELSGIFQQQQTALNTAEQWRILCDSMQHGHFFMQSIPQLLEQLHSHCPEQAQGLPRPVPDVLVSVLIALLQPQPGEEILQIGHNCAEFSVALRDYFDMLQQDLPELPLANLYSASSATEQERSLIAASHQLSSTSMPYQALDYDVLQTASVDVLFANGFNNLDEQADILSQLALLDDAWRFLKPGGRAVLLLEDQVLSSPEGRQIRADLLANCQLHTLLRLPNGLFYGDSQAAHLLFISAGQPTEEIWCYDMRSQSPWFDPLHQPLSADYLRPFEQAYTDELHKRCDQGEQGLFRCFTRRQLAQQQWDLDILWLDDEWQTPLNAWDQAFADTLHDLQALEQLFAS